MELGGARGAALPESLPIPPHRYVPGMPIPERFTVWLVPAAVVIVTLLVILLGALWR